MRIIDMNENSVNACAQFEYKGWTVSMSTIFNKRRVEVHCWNDCGNEFTASSVESAISTIREMESA